MFVTCVTQNDIGRQVFFVLEPLNASNYAFWRKYLEIAKRSSPTVAPSATASSAMQTHPAQDVSDMHVAIDGFNRALALMVDDGWLQYVAYSSFNEKSITTNDDWKALNIQMCMTVNGHEGLPFLTHMGIFASPLSTADVLPKEYEQLKPNLDGKSPRQYFAEKRAAKISLLLHSFAVQAFSALHTRNVPQFMVTKPIGSMVRIFLRYPQCIVQSEKCVSNQVDLLKSMKTTCSRKIGYYVDSDSSTVFIIVRMPDFSLAPYLLLPSSARTTPYLLSTTSYSRIDATDHKEASSSRPAPSTASSQRVASITCQEPTITSARSVSIPNLPAASRNSAHSVSTSRPASVMTSSSSSSAPEVHSKSVGSTSLSSARSVPVTTRPAPSLMSARGVPITNRSTPSLTSTHGVPITTHPAHLMASCSSGSAPDAHSASVGSTSSGSAASDIYPASNVTSRPPNMAGVVRPWTMGGAPCFFMLAFNPKHKADTVFINAITLAELCSLALNVNKS